MDRCALFVDAGYVLADGAMAVHGTRRRESVSWDYEGLLQLLGSLATERSGLPLLRCYWYEATVEGRRSADHDALADLPGVKLRLAKMRPGRREGVEGEIHRDLTTLARNKAMTDAMLVSADEDLAPVIADVQDLGLRISLLHIAVDGNWTISRALRQECDDIVEISSEHLRPYVELISGAEPPRPDERDAAPLIALRPVANGSAPAASAAAYAAAPAGPDNGHPAPPASYSAPVVADYQRPASPAAPHAGDLMAARDESQAVAPAAAQEPYARPDLQLAGQEVGAAPRDPLTAAADLAPPGADLLAAAPDLGSGQPDVIPAWQDQPPARQDLAAGQWEPQPAARQDFGPRPDIQARADLPARPAAQARPDLSDLSGYTPGGAREQLPRDPMIREPFSREPLAGEAADGLQPVPAAPAATGSAQVRRLPTRGGGTGPLPQAPQAPQVPQVPGQVPQVPGQPMTGQPTAAQPTLTQATTAHPVIGQPAPGQPAQVMPIAPGAGYAPGRNGAYSGPQPAIPPGAPAGISPVPGPVTTAGHAGQLTGNGPVSTYGQGALGGISAGPGVGPGGPAMSGTPAGPAAYSGAQPAVSLAEAVQSAHDEGQEFGATVARDAPALWLEAVLARKPRMPSDLEARLLQGSALPIDFLLHDEVRHALRRGFWDAMERARR